MMIYNRNTNKIENLPTVILLDGATIYSDKLTEQQLNNSGRYFIEYQSMPDLRYYNIIKTENLVGNKYIISYTPIERPISEVHEAMLKDLKDVFIDKSERPRVDSGLGYFVDGSRIDKENFEIGKDLGLPKVKDADNQWHDVTDSDYDTIILAIKIDGAYLWDMKNTKEKEILALATVEECILYEATPYEAEVEEIDEATLEPTGKMITVIKYRNNVKEW